MKSVLRSLEVLEAVSEHQPIAVGELARLLDVPKSTAQRTLITLHEAGWLRQAPGAVTSWEISPKILSIRPPALRDGMLAASARGPMTTLRDRVDETVHLCLPNGPEGVILIDRIDALQQVRSFNPLGERSPYWTTATGKAILAFLPEEQFDAVVAASPDFPSADVRIQELTRELQEIREKRYAINIEGHRAGVSAIGAPIRDLRGEPVASICISVPSSRFDAGRIEENAALVVAAAEEISRRIS